MEPAVEVAGLTRRFGEKTAVDDIAFRVEAGEIFGFLGPNGAGKTTTQRILTTLLLPTAGRAAVFGLDVARSPAAVRRRIGLVPEESNVYDELTGLQNLSFTGRLYRIPRAERERRARETLNTFDLWDDRDVHAQHYSKGMRRRLAIAMALLHRPDLLFLDEPTAGLDARSRQVIHQRIRDLQEGGTTVFLTTHYIEEAERLCNRAAIIHHGRIAAIDTPDELRRTVRRARSVDVSFASPPDPSLADALDQLPGVEAVHGEGRDRRLHAPDPAAILLPLLEAAEAAGNRVVHLHTREPSLEEVFLEITAPETAPGRDETAAHRGES